MNSPTKYTPPAEAGGYALCSMPAPPQVPLYVTVEQAAELAGVSVHRMREYACSSTDPIPQIACGRAKRLIRAAALPGYLARREAGA